MSDYILGIQGTVIIYVALKLHEQTHLYFHSNIVLHHLKISKLCHFYVNFDAVVKGTVHKL